MMRLKVTTSQSYVYDQAEIERLHVALAPDPRQFGTDPVIAVFAYLHDSQYGGDVFYSQDDFDSGYEYEGFDPDA